MLSTMKMHLALHGAGFVDRMHLPGDGEPASLRRNVEHRRVLAEMRKESRDARRGSEPQDGRMGVIARFRESFGR